HSWSTYLRSIRTAAHLARSFPRKRESRFLIWVPACAGTSGSEAKHRVAPGSTARVLLVAVEVRFEWVMRTVIDFEHNCLFVRERRPVHLPLRIAVERARCERDAGVGVFVTPLQAEHELVRGVIMGRRNPRTFRELDQRDRSSGLLIAPKHFFRDAFERLLAPRQPLGLNQNLLQVRSSRRHLHHRAALHGAIIPVLPRRRKAAGGAS